jgi:mannosyltransferase OCH1-like enzyme
MKECFKDMVYRISDFEPLNYENDWRWQLLAELYDKNYQPSITSNLDDYTYTHKIPKRIHQIWLGSEFPEGYKEWADSWKQLNPDYEYRLWTDADVDELKLPNLKAYKTITNPGPRSDILRYHILNKYGGIYIDTDFECLKSFDDLSYLEFYTSVGYPSSIEVYPGLMACTPGHPIIKKLVSEIDKVNRQTIVNKGILNTTSSYLFTRIFFEMVKEYQKGIVAFPPDYFYPYPNNFKGFREINGRSFIKDCSYAIHYWEQSWNGVGIRQKPKPNTDVEDWIQGFKFVKMADFVYSPNVKADDDYAKYPNTFDPAQLKDVNIVSTCTMYLARLIRILNHLPQKFIILNHNGDEHTEDGMIVTYANAKKTFEEPYILTDNIIRLYTVNPDVIHPRIELLPVGIENSMWKSQKKEIMSELRKRLSVRNGFVLMNHSMNTNREERQKVYDLFKPISWVSTYDKTTYEQFYRLLASFKFVLNPMGNCFDNHRMWEAFYLGCIPITKRCVMTSFYEDMPMVIIDNWEQVTKEFLDSEYERIMNTLCNLEKMWMPYWEKKIRQTV